MTIPESSARIDKRMVTICAILLLIYLLLVARTVVLPGELLPMVYLTIVSAAIAFFNASHMFGWRPALALFLLSAVVCWTMEELGIRYSVGTAGAYYYTDVLGPKLGRVPFVIPLSWFTSIYVAYVIANLIVKGRYEYRVASWGGTIWLAFVASMIQTSWDLTLDPYMVTKMKAWVWVEGGPYFGIPLGNYFGWVFVTTLVLVLFRRSQTRLKLLPLGAIPWWVCIFPMAGYGINMATTMVLGDPEATRLIAFFAMGTPLFLAGTRLYQSNQAAE